MLFEYARNILRWSVAAQGRPGRNALWPGTRDIQMLPVGLAWLCTACIRRCTAHAHACLCALYNPPVKNAVD